MTSLWEDREKAETQKILDRLDQTKTRMQNKDKTIEELKYERNLIFKDLCRIINDEVRLSFLNLFMGFNVSDFLNKAWRWHCRKEALDEEFAKGELSKRDYESYKTSFDIAVDTVTKSFFGELKDKVQFKAIIAAWTTGYDFVYTYKDQEITIFVPVFHADERDWEYALMGYRVNYRESEYVQEWIYGGLDYQEVAKKLQEWMLSEGWLKSEKNK